MASADAMARSTNVVSAKAKAAEAAAIKAAAQRAAAARAKATPRPGGGSADAMARNASAASRAAESAKIAQAARAAASTQPQFGMSADAASVNSNIVGEEAAQAELAARQEGEARAAAYVKPPPVPVYRQSGSGRSTSDYTGMSDGSGTGLAPVPAAFVPPESVTAAPAVVQPPAVVANATPSENNVPGESFTTVGSPGTFGQLERRRASRGPKSGLSVTPEMIRRAAATRLG